MTEKPAPVTPVVTENIPSLAGGVSAIASANAPFIYFDGVPNFGFNFGVANIPLEALRARPPQAGLFGRVFGRLTNRP